MILYRIISGVALVAAILNAVAGEWFTAIWASNTALYAYLYASTLSRPHRTTYLTAFMPPDMDEREFANRIADALKDDV